MIFKIPLLISFVSTLLIWGGALSPNLTLTSAQLAPSVSFKCRINPKTFKCFSPYQGYSGADSGATTWQDITADYFFSNKTNWPNGEFPRWNPYIGTGYPIEYDGMHTHWSWFENITRAFPSDNGRDTLTLTRIFLFVLGVVVCLHFLGATPGFLFLGGILAALARYLCIYLDITFFDIDLMAPWALAVIIGIQSKQSKYVIYLISLLLGLHVGTQGFLQSHVAFVISLVVLYILGFLFRSNLRIIFISAILFFIPYTILALPRLLSFIPVLSSFVSSRNSQVCLATSGIGLTELWRGALSFKRLNWWGYVAPLGTFLLILSGILKKENRFILSIFFFFSIWFIFGLPSFICQFPLISGVRYIRHIQSFVDSLVVICTVLGLQYIWKNTRINQKKWIKITTRFILIIIGIVPLLHNEFFNDMISRGRAQRALPAFAATIPESSPLAAVQNLSQNQDRRHFSPDRVLFPNWSGVFKIMDIRLLYALFPKSFYTLHANLFNDWEHDSSMGLVPDRFIGPANIENGFAEGLQKILLLDRVSLFSFHSGKSYFPKSGPYSKCNHLGKDEVFESYICPEISGVGYFPSQIRIVQDDNEAIEKIKNTTLADLKNTAWIEIPKNIKNNRLDLNQSLAASGNIVSHFRSGHLLEYRLLIRSSGYFVIADTYFPGWKAYVNGKNIPILKANIASKAVILPAGNIDLKLIFEPKEE